MYVHTKIHNSDYERILSFYHSIGSPIDGAHLGPKTDRHDLTLLYVHTVPDTSYLRGSKVFRSFSAKVSVKVREDICSATAPLPRTTRADSAEGFTTGLCTSDCVDSR